MCNSDGGDTNGGGGGSAEGHERYRYVKSKNEEEQENIVQKAYLRISSKDAFLLVIRGRIVTTGIIRHRCSCGDTVRERSHCLLCTLLACPYLF